MMAAKSCKAALFLATASMLPLAPTALAAGKHYQEQRSLDCASGFCTGTFPKVGNGEVLVLETLICDAGIEMGAIEDAYFSFTESGGKQFIVKLGLDWQRNSGAFTFYTFSRHTDIQVGGGKQISGVLPYAAGSPTARCTVSGSLLKQ